MLVDLISGLFIGAGGLFVLIGALGIIRLPDVFSRMQSVSLIETVGAGLLCMGFIVKVGFSLVGLKLILLLTIIFFLGPVVTHAVAQAALAAGVKPLLVHDRRSAATKADEQPVSASVDKIKTPNVKASVKKAPPKSGSKKADI
jgi:multicomponent Na+:H+ antiporter subunit G